MSRCRTHGPGRRRRQALDHGHGNTIPNDLGRYLVNDKKYDLDSESLGRLVDDITRGKKTYYARARAIYEYLTKVITYDRTSGWNNATTVLARGTGGRSNRHVVTTRGGGSSALLDWTYNSHTLYDVRGAVTLEEQSIARYRPLKGEGAVPVSSAPRVVAPRLTEPTIGEQHRKPTEQAPSSPVGDPWMTAIAVLLAGGLGAALGRGWRRSN